jgi:hypothetical protein
MIQRIFLKRLTNGAELFKVRLRRNSGLEKAEFTANAEAG